MTKVLYFAYKDGEKIVIGGDAALDRLLGDGYQIMKVENDKVDLIATPEQGWLTERPVIQRHVSGRSK